jgi:peptidoglycan/LPS O-acetylase OafA/YrhL
MISSTQRSESEIDASVTAPTRFYVPSLDGIRVIAFAIVFFSHIGDGSHGLFGVTIFYFLSGYLITTLLRRENDRHGGISLRSFYLRRTLRIMPPFYVTMLVILVLALSRLQPTSSIAAPFVATCHYCPVIS